MLSLVKMASFFKKKRKYVYHCPRININTLTLVCVNYIFAFKYYQNV